MNSDIESLDEILDGLANYCRTKLDETFDDPSSEFDIWRTALRKLRILSKEIRDL